MASIGNRWVWSFVVTGFVVLAALIAGAIALDSYLDPFDDRPFDPAAWAVADHDGRMSMARDAVRRISPGMTEEEVVGLLGKPDSIEESHRLTASVSPRAARTYLYYIGSSSLSSLRGLDSAFVWVHLGNDGRVLSAIIGGG